MSGPIVDTSLGRLEGLQREGHLVFRGVPYAAPPVGPRRFAPPAPAEPWAGIRAATEFGPMAPQNPGALESALGSPPGTADEAGCLTLNVFTPAADDGRRPVMVWIHGGAFVSGQGSTPWYDGRRFTARDVVVVTINYRLGALGFLHLEELGGESFAGAGLAGILDQVEALRWVGDNIAAFGGDPGNVTIFGESAGAMSVGTLLGVPAARGLFHRAVLQSGAASSVATSGEATSISLDLLSALGLDRGQVAKLRELPTEAVLAVQASLAGRGRPGLLFRPTVDGHHLPVAPNDAVRDGAVADVPLLIGTNLDEWNLFSFLDERANAADEETVLKAVGRLAPGLDPKNVVAVYRATRPEATPGALLSAITTDSVFRMPAIRLAEAQMAAGGPAYMYLFTWPTPAFGGRLGSCHAVEIPFVFDSIDRRGAAFLTGDEPPRLLAGAMNEAWAGFARDGVPAAAALDAWPRYNPVDRPTMVLDVTSRVEPDPLGAERLCWDGVSG